MEFFGNKNEVIYFIYGLAFFTLGVSALQQSTRKANNLAFLRSLKYLACFGIIHGISEWVGMTILIKGYTYSDFHIIFWVKMFLNAISFIFLLSSGLTILSIEFKRVKINLIPWILFGLWTTTFLLLEYYYQVDTQSSWCKLYCTLNRYFIGLPAGMIMGYALYKNAEQAKRLNLTSIAVKIKILGVMFFAYGILSGLVVRKGEFFPSVIINVELVESIFLIPIELIRAILAVLITIVFVKIVNNFTWEMERKISLLQKEQAVDQERRKLGRELHDITIQKLFSTGLKIENIIEDTKDSGIKEELSVVKTELNDVISGVRNVISFGYRDRIEHEKFDVAIADLINHYNKNFNGKIDLLYQIPTSFLNRLLPDIWTQIYYIVQEGISNIIKHSKATSAQVALQSNGDGIFLEMRDNGEGFGNNESKPRSYGLVIMGERVAIAKGTMDIQTDTNGTIIKVFVPWEDVE